MSTRTTPIANTSDPVLYHSNRFDGLGGAELRYQFEVPNGAYTVRLHFAELYDLLKGAGRRVFDIDVQSVRAFENVDIFVLAGGGDRALILETDANVSSGQLAIDFLHQVENPKINAIEILPVGPPPDTEPPSPPGGLTFSNVNSTSLTVSWTAATDNVGVSGYRVMRGTENLGEVAELSFHDDGLSPGTAYQYAIMAVDAAGNTSAASSATISTASGGPAFTPLRINAGGGSYVDSSGNTWLADTGYNTGTVSTRTTPITNTSDPVLYHSNRFDGLGGAELRYQFDVPNGTYTVRLHFAEVYDPLEAPGKRVFDIDVQSVRAFENVDIFVLAGGGDRALILETSADVLEGRITIDFLHQVENPKINAIEIMASGAVPDHQPPSAPGTLTFSSVSATSVMLAWTAATDNVGVTGYRVARGAQEIGVVSELSFVDIGLSPGTSYTYSVSALDAGGNTSAASSAAVSTASDNPGPLAIRVNTGGSSYVDSFGNTWLADTGYNTGEKYSVSAAIANTSDPALFRTERFDREPLPDLVYAFGIPNGAYLVRLFFAENFSEAQGPGLRVFDIDVESVRAFEDVDIYVQAGGGNRALVLETATNVADGQLEMAFIRQTQNPKINAIEIQPATVSLVVVDGNNQSAAPATFNSVPFDVALWNGDGTGPITNAPVTFQVVSGGGMLARSSAANAPLSSSITVFTDEDGTAQSYFRHPAIAGVRSEVRAAFGSASLSLWSTSIGGGVPGDLDSDGLADAWEIEHFGNTSALAAGNPDDDGLTNLQEFTIGSNPTEADTDGDGMNDGAEYGSGRDPLNSLDGAALPSGVHVVLAGPTGQFLGINTTTWAITPVTAPAR